MKSHVITTKPVSLKEVIITVIDIITSLKQM